MTTAETSHPSASRGPLPSHGECHDHSAGGIVYLEWTPSPDSPLFGLVRSVWYYEDRSPSSFLERVLPTGEMSLLVNLDEDELRYYESDDQADVGRLPAVALHGLHTRSFLIDTVEQRRIAGAVFAAGGAYPFLGLPMNELHNLHVGADELWGDSALDLRHRMLDQKTSRAVLEVLVQGLLQSLDRDLLPHRVVPFTVSALQATASVRIASIRQRVGLSHRRLSELFKRQVGVTPKRFQRLVRLRRFVIGSATTRELADLALDAGYYDQSHLCHEIRQLTGLTPQQFLSSLPLPRVDRPDVVPHLPVS